MTDTAKWDLRLLWDGDGGLQALSPAPAAPAGALCRPRSRRRAGSSQRGRNRGAAQLRATVAPPYKTGLQELP